MFTLLKELWRLLNYPRLKYHQRKKQKAGGYEIEIPSGSRGEYVVYREGDRWLDAPIDIRWREGVRLYTQGLKTWQSPVKGQALSQCEYDSVVKRVCEYLSIEGKVNLDHSLLSSYEESLASIKSMTKSEGWDLEESGQKFVRRSPKDAGEA